MDYIDEMLAKAPEVMGVKEANRISKAGRDRLYEAIKTGELEAIAMEGTKPRYLIPKRALADWLKAKVTMGEAA